MTQTDHDEMLVFGEANLGRGLDYNRMPGYWLLAQMGKRVLRPGGLELTRQMLEALDIQSTDHVIEFAPGSGSSKNGSEYQLARSTGG